MMASEQDSDDTSYAPSGRVGWQAVPSLLLGCVAAAISAWAYAGAIAYLPYLLNLFALCFFAAWLGWLTTWTCRFGKVRNAEWMVRAATVIALAGWYSQWWAWKALMFDALTGGHNSWALLLAQYTDAFIQPWRLPSGAVELSTLADAHRGSWRVGGYWILPLWVLEFLIILCVSRSSGRNAARSPFCEKSGSWAVPFTLPQRFSPIVHGRRIKDMIRVNPACLAALFEPLPGGLDSDYATVTIHRCRAGDAYLSVRDWGRIAGGSLERHMSDKLSNERLHAVDVDTLISALKRRAAQCPAADQASESARPTPSELSFALRRLQEGDNAMALSLATPHLLSAKPEVRRDAVRLCALAAGGAGRWGEARSHWLAVFENCADAHAAMQVATSSVMAGDIPQGAVWFDTAEYFHDYEETNDPPWPTMLLSMLTALGNRRELRASIRYVEALRDYYARAETTDTTAQDMDGMPPFTDFLNNSLPIVRAALPETEWRAWYEAISDAIDDAGRRQLHAWLDAQLAPAT